MGRWRVGVPVSGRAVASSLSQGTLSQGRLSRALSPRGLLLQGLVFLGLLVGLAGCASPPPPPTVVNVKMAADPSDNPATPGGAGTPLVITLYQLSSDAAFSSAEFFQLFSADAATLKSDMVKKDQYILAPGASKSMTINPLSTVTAIGVFAAYQSFQTVTWRATVEVAPNKTTGINVQAGAKGIVVKTDPASALKAGP
jgi:type VI secretion system VasD/TssJ family lipoprotein